jgi:hypothetical protein
LYLNENMGQLNCCNKKSDKPPTEEELRMLSDLNSLPSDKPKAPEPKPKK